MMMDGGVWCSVAGRPQEPAPTALFRQDRRRPPPTGHVSAVRLTLSVSAPVFAEPPLAVVTGEWFVTARLVGVTAYGDCR